MVNARVVKFEDLLREIMLFCILLCANVLVAKKSVMLTMQLTGGFGITGQVSMEQNKSLFQLHFLSRSKKTVASELYEFSVPADYWDALLSNILRSAKLDLPFERIEVPAIPDLENTVTTAIEQFLETLTKECKDLRVEKISVEPEEGPETELKPDPKIIH